MSAKVRRRPEIHRPDLGAEHEQRNDLARVIGRRRRRVVAVIGGKDNEVLLPDPVQQTGNAPVELPQTAMESRRHRSGGPRSDRTRSRWPAATPAACAQSAPSIKRVRLRVGLGVNAGDSAAGEQIVHLADARPAGSAAPPAGPAGSGPGGGRLKSRRLAVRFQAPGSPTNGRAMTRETPCSPRRSSRARCAGRHRARPAEPSPRGPQPERRCPPRYRRSSCRSGGAPLRTHPAPRCRRPACCPAPRGRCAGRTHQSPPKETHGDRWGTVPPACRPQISQCPVVLSLPGLAGSQTPCAARASATGATPASLRSGRAPGPRAAEPKALPRPEPHCPGCCCRHLRRRRRHGPGRCPRRRAR